MMRSQGFRGRLGEWWLLAALAAVTAEAVPPAGYEPADDGHLDFVFCYQNGVWKQGLIWDQTSNPLYTGPAVGTVIPAALAPVVARDQAYPSGNRVIRPQSDDWAFVGVEGGSPFWWFSQTQTGGAWPGFAACGDCATYFSADPRVEASSAWKVVTLRSVRYRGLGVGHYSLWSAGTLGQLTVWMSTADGGITDEDRFFISSSGHAHASMGFSDLGLYEVTFTVTCHTGPGETNPVTSPESSFYFAVGTYWEWIARHFEPQRWWDAVSAESADPDGDGVTNLMEYACGLDPRRPDATPHEPGGVFGLPTLSVNEENGMASYHFPVRLPQGNPQIVTSVEASAEATPGSWLPEGFVTEPASGEIGSGSATLLPRLLFGPSARYFRLSISLQPTIPYAQP